MVAASPFQGLRFDRAVVGDPCRVTAPPYDVITPESRDAYEAMHPYNVVRLILARGGRDDPSRYAQVAKLLTSWHEEGALLLDPAPALYVYEEAYTLRGERRRLRGVLASVTLDDNGDSVVPHERTMVAPVADRLRLLEATRANLSPVFAVYSGSGRPEAALGAVDETPPAVDCLDETGTGHRLWPVSDPRRIAAWCRALADKRVLIADGHHRYRTALDYRDAMRRAEPGHPTAPWEQTLMLLVDIDRHGPAVLAIHRLLSGATAEAVLEALGGDFEARALRTPLELEAELDRLPPGAIGYGLYGGGGRALLLVARDPAALAARTGLDHPPLDVEVLHGPVLAGLLGVRDPERQVTYESDLAQAVARVDRGDFASLLALRPAPFSAVVDVAQRGRTLPPKTTFFYPKPRDGLVLRPLEPEDYPVRPPRERP
jgi:uncharacterized protein (DUF1015 family)